MSYAKGSIKRVTLRNFMTHADCELFPGPKLNLIIGANGSGKSSILCAISLGLGGEPKDLGRSNQASAYIKNGESECMIEIELVESSKTRKNPVIKRIIKHGESENSRGITIWFWNNEKKSHAFVVESLQELCINVRNLCQVLPQDRVGDFSKFDAVTLLNETVRASLTEKFLNIKEDIYTLAHKIKQDTRVTNQKKVELEKTKHNNAKLEEKVVKLKKRKKIEEDLSLLEKLKHWMMYNIDKCKLDTQKMDLSKQEDLSQKIEKESLNKAKKIATLNTNNEELEDASISSSKKFGNDSSDLLLSIKRLKVSSNNLEDSFQDLRDLHDEKDSVEERIVQHEIKVEKIKQALAEHPDITDSKSRLKEISREKTPIADKLVKIERDMKHLSLEKSKIEGDARAIIKEQEKNKNENTKRSRFMLLSFGKDAERVYNLVLNKSSFESPVLGPIMLEIFVRKSLYAHYVEKIVKKNTFKSYVTQSAKDRKVLMTARADSLNLEFRDKNDMKMHKFRKLQDYPGAEELKALGIEGFGIEFVSCVDTIKEALFRVTSLPNILFATAQFEKVLQKGSSEEVYDTVSRILGMTSFRIISPNYFHDKSVSRYSRQTIINTTPIRLQGAQLKFLYKSKLKGSNKRDSMVNREKELVAHEEDLNHIRKQIGDLEVVKTDLAQQRKDLTKEYQEIEKSKNNYYALGQKLETEKFKYNEALKGRKRNFAAEQEKLQEKALKDLCKLKDKRVATIINQTTNLVSFVPSFTDDVIGYSQASFKVQLLKKDIKYLKFEKKKIKDNMKAAQKSINKRSRDLEETLHRLEEEIPLQTYQERFKETGIKEVAQLQQRIEELELELSSTLSDPSLLLEFESGRKTIARLKPEIEELEKTLVLVNEELVEKKTTFETAVRAKVDIINRKYKEMFQTINDAGFKCEGEVKFLKSVQGKTTSDENKYNYKNFVESFDEEDTNENSNQTINYGIGIFVKFRASQQLEQLNSEVQSGGERSLSTFLYLLSLQECSAAPFRLVDEINQGMDSEKERLAFHCLVENCAREEVPQYFLITPKLLNGLKYGTSIQINFVNNGAFAMRQQYFNLKSELEDSNVIEADNESNNSLSDYDSEAENTPGSQNSKSFIKDEKVRKRQKRK